MAFVHRYSLIKEVKSIMATHKMGEHGTVKSPVMIWLQCSCVSVALKCSRVCWCGSSIFFFWFNFYLGLCSFRDRTVYGQKREHKMNSRSCTLNVVVGTILLRRFLWFQWKEHNVSKVNACKTCDMLKNVPHAKLIKWF